MNNKMLLGQVLTLGFSFVVAQTAMSADTGRVWNSLKKGIGATAATRTTETTVIEKMFSKLGLAQKDGLRNYQMQTSDAAGKMAKPTIRVERDFIGEDKYGRELKGLLEEGFVEQEIDGKIYKVAQERQVALETYYKQDLNQWGYVDKEKMVDEWRVNARRVSRSAEGKMRSDINGNQILFERNTHKDTYGLPSKAVLVDLSKLFPANYKVIGFNAKEDLSEFTVQVMQGNKAAKEYTYRVREKNNRWDRYNSFERTGIKEISLSDFYVGEVADRQAAKSAVKGMSVGSNAK